MPGPPHCPSFAVFFVFRESGHCNGPTLPRRAEKAGFPPGRTQYQQQGQGPSGSGGQLLCSPRSLSLLFLKRSRGSQGRLGGRLGTVTCNQQRSPSRVTPVTRAVPEERSRQQTLVASPGFPQVGLLAPAHRRCFSTCCDALKRVSDSFTSCCLPGAQPGGCPLQGQPATYWVSPPGLAIGGERHLGISMFSPAGSPALNFYSTIHTQALCSASGLQTPFVSSLSPPSSQATEEDCDLLPDPGHARDVSALTLLVPVLLVSFGSGSSPELHKVRPERFTGLHRRFGAQGEPETSAWLISRQRGSLKKSDTYLTPCQAS